MKICIPPIALHAGQRRILESRARFRVASCGRRFGKTLLAVEWLALMPGGAIDGTPTAFFAPTYKILLDVWADMDRTLKPVTRKANKTEMRIELITGGKIDFWSLEDANAGRSRKYNRIILDEAAHARYLQEAWERAISPTLTDYRGEAWFISTPNGLNYFHTLFQRSNNDPDWESFQMPTSVNPHIDPAEIEMARQQLPELVFRQEYLAEFVTFGAGLVRPEYIRRGTPPAIRHVVLGVDLAIGTKTTNDWTVIAAMGRDDTGRPWVLEVERFRAGFAEIVQRILAAGARWNPALVAVEEVQYQAAVVQELARTSALPVRGVRPDRDKITRFLPLLTRYERGEVYHDPARVPAWLEEELVSFPQGEHDDGVDALSYAWAGLSQVHDRPDYSRGGRLADRPATTVRGMRA
jgi:predicted phage terminase large subunit-like protein